MEYRKFDRTIVARLNKGEEILEQIKNIALKEKIKLASISAIGATNDFIVGAFSTATNTYDAHEFKGDHEILSLLGNITTYNGEFYCHLHMTAGNMKGEAVGGHLNRAIISVTCEIFINVLDGIVDRVEDPDNGIKVFKFND